MALPATEHRAGNVLQILRLATLALRALQGESARVRCRSPIPDNRAAATSATPSNGHRSSPTSAAVRPESAFAARPASAPPHPAPPATACRRPRPSPSSQWRKPARGLQSLHLPLRHRTAGRQQRQACTLAIGIVEQLRQQALGIAQCLMATGRSRRVDDHQPQLMRRARALLEQHILALAWPAVEQRARPIDRAATGRVTFTLFTVIEASCARSGIRPRVRSRANA